MGLEAGGYISDLVSSNPGGTDLESQGDDHLRLIKAALQATFTNAARIFRFPDTKASQTSTYSVSETADLHKLIPFNCTGGAVTADLPATTIDGWWCLIRKTDSSANAVTIDPSGAGTINGASTITLTKQYEGALVWWDNQASTWAFFRHYPSTPYYSGGQDIPFSDIAPSGNAKRILGAATATDFSEQTIAAVLEWIGTCARGDILLRGASAFDRKALGASGTVLVSDGTDLIYGSPPIPARSYVEYTTSAALTVALPCDDTIPQIGEGTEVLSTTITPIKTSSRIRVEVHLWGCSGGLINWAGALFKDGAANAVRAAMVTNPAAGYVEHVTLSYEFAPGSISAITFTVRVGTETGASMRLNGIDTARKLGGSGASTITVTELFTA